MPLADAGFVDSEGRADHTALISFGPSLEVIVSAFVDPLPPPTERRTRLALADPGATQSYIDIQVVESLHLPVVDFVMIAETASESRHLLYAAKVAFPALEIFQFGAFAGVDLTAEQQPHRVLLGRTFLQSTVMIYDGVRGQVTLASYRIPD